MSERFYHHHECDCDDSVGWRCATCSIWTEGIAEGLAQAEKLVAKEREAVTSHLFALANDWTWRRDNGLQASDFDRVFKAIADALEHINASGAPPP